MTLPRSATLAVALSAALFLVAACGGKDNGSPSAPTPATVNVSGLWSGTYSSSQLGFGRATLSLNQSGTAVSGTWTTTPDPGGGSSIGAGTVSGTLTPTGSTGTSGSLSLRLQPSNPLTCPFQFTGTTGTATEGRVLVGEWVTVSCTVTASGGLILKQT